MASHRKPRTRILQSAASRRGAAGVTTAAFASVTLLSQSAHAAPDDNTRPSAKDVQKQVDRLYRQAETATQKYNAAQEKSGAQRKKADRALDQVAERTDKLNDARRELGNYATAQYRTGGVSPTATLLLSQDPQSFVKKKHTLDRMTGHQQKAVTEYEKQQKSASSKRAEAQHRLSALTTEQRKLQDSKRAVQGKLSEARKLLSKLTEQEKARLAAAERRKEAEARRKAAEAERKQQKHNGDHNGSQGNESSGAGGSSGGSAATSAGKVLSFAKAQLGKPYVWGATGPASYDCSGLTQGAWKSAGVSLPRTTWDQVKTGSKVSKPALQPGDLIFFYDDISHVGIYSGGGQMIHAPKPGAEVRYESINNMPFHSAVRPG